MPKKVSREARLPRITEAEFQRQVLALAALRGWLRCHFRPARTSRGWRTPLEGDAGYPDLTLVRGDRLILAELKREGGRTTAEQDRWLEPLRRTPCEVYLWMPSMWPEIEEVLR